MGLDLVQIDARDLPDAWFQGLIAILRYGRRYRIDRGSYAGQERLELDYVTVRVRHPGTRRLLPDIPASMGIPNPVAEGYVEEYLPYLMTPAKALNEDYTYGERLAGWHWWQLDPDHPEWGCLPCEINQIDHVVKMYREQGPGTNQAAMAVAIPSDILLADPPCLRHVDTRLRDGRLHFFVYFRSWDLWGGFPANLAALQMLKEYMVSEIGCQDGELVATSKGLHLYDYAWELARIRTGKG